MTNHDASRDGFLGSLSVVEKEIMSPASQGAWQLGKAIAKE
jgi:hypothetical protein